ncbi:isoleucine--tRNA ligase [Patescibacteria group bacterium]|nr:isoleucine--tRNA ligase [Patescibacteria group bacterium]
MPPINFPQLEEKILKFWQKNKIFDKLVKKNQGQKVWSFLDGPITANNPMGVHHAWGRTYKDLFQRYKAMQGFDQRWQNGFDCQGLWVEVEVEKEKGFKTKKDIEKFGVEKFVQACKQRVLKYSKIQTKQSIRLGQWMDWKNSYYTMSDENNYAIWSFLKKCYQKKWLYKGLDVVPWCPRCATSISQHEILTEEYQEVIHQSIFIQLPLLNQKNTFFLVWTTTPWTLPANAALAVHPDLIYAKVQDKKGNIYIVLESKADLVSNGQILETFPGQDLVNLKYQGMFDQWPAIKEPIKGKEHLVVSWKDVSKEEGTGIVHIAPGCGQEDFQLSKEFDLPVINPTNEESQYQEGFEFLTGKLVTKVNDLIFDYLTKNNFVFKIKDYQHRYPTCWRCKSELIFRLVDEWYISMEHLRKPLVKVSKLIQWLPAYGLDRELDWLKNMQDWMISKKRYWGLALPIYECQECGNFEVIGSKEELEEKAVAGWEKFKGHSPHRPWIDQVKIKCAKCGEIVSRITDVGNPWLDAGIIPFSTLKYFSDKKYWRKWFPTDFVCESFPGQFKNWFYSLIVMSTVLENSVPTKTIFGYALVRDEQGEEMHKSKDNVIWLDQAIEESGADVLRWIYTIQNPFNNLRFGEEKIRDGRNKLSILWNSFIYFDTYADKTGLGENSPGKVSQVLDRWILSRLNNLIASVTENLDQYNPMAAASALENFFVEDLSRWYIRRSRKRFSSLGKNKDKSQASQTLYFVFLNLSKLAAPIIPFLTEEIYSSLKTSQQPESIHLFAWPQAKSKLIDQKLEKQMIDVQKICETGHNLRVEAQIKARQPLSQISIVNGQWLSEELIDLIKDELNVKEIQLVKALPKGKAWQVSQETEIKLALNTEITPELKKQGLVRELVRRINFLRKVAKLTKDDWVDIYYQTENQDLKQVINEYKELLNNETVSRDILSKPVPANALAQKQVNIDGQDITLALVKK